MCFILSIFPQELLGNRSNCWKIIFQSLHIQIGVCINIELTSVLKKIELELKEGY